MCFVERLAVCCVAVTCGVRNEHLFFDAFGDPPVSTSYMPFQSDHKVMAHTVPHPIAVWFEPNVAMAVFSSPEH
jgi:hypothetical protein